MPEKTRPGGLELLAVVVVDLVAVPVPLLDPGLAVGLPDDRARRRGRPDRDPAAWCRRGRRRPRRRLLLLHGGDHRLGAVGVELRRGGLLEARDVAGVLDDHALQAQAQAEGRDAVGAGVASARRACPRARGRRSRRARRSRRRRAGAGGRPRRSAHSSEGDPPDVDLGVVGEAAGPQRLARRRGRRRGRSTYLPTSATVTSSLGWCTRRSRSSQVVQSTSRNGRSRRRTR